MKRFIYILAILFMGSSLAAQVDFKVTANQTEVAVGQRFSVEFKINQQGDDFRAPSFQGLQILGGPNTSVSTYMDNSGTRYTLSYGYILKALKKGEYTIGPAFVKVEGRTYKTDPITIKVVDQPQGRRDVPKDVFLKAYVSDPKVYQGEPIFANYRLYFRSEVYQHSFQEEPDFTGFYRENIEQNRIETEEEYIDGRRFYSADLRKMVLIPQKSGSFDPGNIAMSIPVRIQSRRRDIFGFPVSRTENRDLLASFPKIEVKPLPTKGRPTNFSGAVGQYDLSAEISETNIDTDGSITLKVKIEGRGNIKLAEIPQIEFPKAFEVFDPEIKERSSVGSFGMKGYKTVEYLLVPRYGGEYKIGPIEFTYFDPQKEKYIRKQSEEFVIKVSGGSLSPSEKQSGVISPGENEQVDFINKDILYIKTRASWKNKDGVFLGSGLFWGLLSLPFIIGFAAFFLWLQRRKESEQGDLLRVQRAAKVARKRLSKAQKALKASDPELFYQELESALWGYFEDRLKIPKSELSKDLLRSQLEEKNLKPELLDALFKTFEKSEMARFTGLKVEAAQQDFEETTSLITEIEKGL